MGRRNDRNVCSECGVFDAFEYLGFKKMLLKQLHEKKMAQSKMSLPNCLNHDSHDYGITMILFDASTIKGIL